MKKEYLELVKQLHGYGMRNSEIAEAAGIGRNRVSELLKYAGLIPNADVKLTVSTNEQLQILIGTIIGDGCLFKDGNGAKHRINLAHCLEQREYFYSKYLILKDLIRSEPFTQTQQHQKTGKTHSCVKFQSRVNELYTDLYNEYYKDGKKVLTDENVAALGWQGIAVKYFDDGNYIRGAGAISMCNYSAESIATFQNLLLKKFGIETTIQKNGVIYIKKSSFQKFKENIIRYATSDVLYKLGELPENPAEGNRQAS